jgi:hypothetical protein
MLAIWFLILLFNLLLVFVFDENVFFFFLWLMLVLPNLMFPFFLSKNYINYEKSLYQDLFCYISGVRQYYFLLLNRMTMHLLSKYSFSFVLFFNYCRNLFSVRMSLIKSHGLLSFIINYNKACAIIEDRLILD